MFLNGRWVMVAGSDAESINKLDASDVLNSPEVSGTREDVQDVSGWLDKRGRSCVGEKIVDVSGLPIHDTGWTSASGSMHQQHMSGQCRQARRHAGRKEGRMRKGKGDGTEEEGQQKVRKKVRRNEGEEVERKQTQQGEGRGTKR